MHSFTKALVARSIAGIATVAACGCGGEPAASPGSSGPFVGRVEAKTTTDGGGGATGTCVISAHRLACQTLLGSQGRVVVAFDDEQKKSCTKIASGAPDVESYEESAKTNAQLKGRGTTGAHGAFTKTGKSSKVAGRTCDEWQAQSPSTTWTACVDASLRIDVKGPPGTAAPMLGFDGLPGFALSSEVTPRDGGPVIATTVTKLEPRSVDDSEFAACPTR